jgi:hypothetical protein
VRHTFAGFECVGDAGLMGAGRAATGGYDNSFPLIPTSGMSGAPGTFHCWRMGRLRMHSTDSRAGSFVQRSNKSSPDRIVFVFHWLFV